MFSSKFLTKGFFFPKSPIQPKSPTQFSKYEIVKDADSKDIVLGEGASGKVLLLKKKETNDLFVVKGLGKMDLKSLRSLKKESEIQGRLHHNNIIRIYDVMEDSQTTLLVMEYAACGSLGRLLKEKGRLTEREAFVYFVQVCDAVHFLHSHDLIHRDIKPSNLLLTTPSQVKLGDFDCCTSSNYRLKVLCGTSEYIAPEVLGYKPYDEKADIWSLGILLFEMLHGYTPFKAATRCEIYMRIFKGKIVFSAAIKNDLKDLILRMLRLQDKRRPTTEEILNHPWIQRMNREKEGSEEVIRSRATLELPRAKVLELTKSTESNETIIEEKEIEEITLSITHTNSARNLIQNATNKPYISPITKRLSSKKNSCADRGRMSARNKQNDISLLSLVFSSIEEKVL